MGAKSRKYLAERPELLKESRKKHYYKDIDKSREYHRNWMAKQDKAKATKTKRKWYSNNREKVNATVAMRRAWKLQATPKWLTEEHLAAIKIEYDLAAWATKVIGQPFHVDHIVPLQGKTVCGLHVPWNLQVLTATENVRKSNKLLEAV